MSMRFLRQLGLVNQTRLTQLRVLLSGQANDVADLLVLFDQLGVGKDGGCIGVRLEGDDKPTAVFWNLAYPQHPSIGAMVDDQSAGYRMVGEDEITEAWDVHFSMNGQTSDVPLNIFGSVRGPRAALSTAPLPVTSLPEPSGNHPLTPSLRVACAAAMVERMLDELNLRNAVPISDAWVTITCRIETTDEDEARAKVSSTVGMPISMTPTADGLAILARIRLPYPLPLNPFEHLDVQTTQNTSLPEMVDIGLVRWDEAVHPLDEAFVVEESNMIMLGVGGLGSWSAPLLMEQVPSGTFHIVDGDTSIELHNLNRQVLYNEQHLGRGKAEVAEGRLASINPNIALHAYSEHMLPMHIEESLESEKEDHLAFASFDLDEGEGVSELPKALSSSHLFFGCLDNMRARTLLNEAALHHGGVMINGGSESVHGIVERLSDEEGCMVCRYGEDGAREEEIVSCTEEGARPVASIATTTAWAGAMMAVFGLIESSVHRGIELPRLQWHQGAVVSTSVGSKPPWMNEPCLRHI